MVSKLEIQYVKFGISVWMVREGKKGMKKTFFKILKMDKKKCPFLNFSE